jgi:cell wall-associated NlpC family hydrolase
MTSLIRITETPRMPSSPRCPTCLLARLLAVAWILPMATASAATAPVWISDTGLSSFVELERDPTSLAAPAGELEKPAVSTARRSPARVLLDLANRLLNVRYKRGGHEPSTGFDCSGFVSYVFHEGTGTVLPNTSAAQYQSGKAIDRHDLRSGDLVFFRTRGKRISHVGIYVGQGQFIHAPRTGRTVSVSSLAEHYWSRRYAGARRPDVLAAQTELPAGNG